MPTTDDQILLTNAAKKEKQIKKDERTVGQIELLVDRIDILEDKESAELEKIEKSKDYYRKEMKLALDCMEKEINRAKESYEKKMDYYKNQIENLEHKEEKLQERFEKQRERKETKKSRLINKVITKQGKQLLEGEEIHEVKSDLKKAQEIIESNPMSGIHEVAIKYPHIYKQWKQTEKQLEIERNNSPAAKAAKIERANLELADKLRQKELDDEKARMISSANLKAKAAKEKLADARARGATQEEIVQLRDAYHMAEDEARDVRLRYSY